MKDDGSSASRLRSMIRRVSLSNPNTDERKLTEWDREKQHGCRLLYRQTHLLDLPSCLLTEILLSIIKSSDDGPRYFARIRSVCKDFLRAVEDEEILRAITFDGRIKASCQYGFSGHINGLAYRCAGAGNDSAHCLLAKEVVMSVCHLHDKHKTPLETVASASFFLSNFDFVRSPEYKSYDCVPRRSIHHVEVVRTFFLECSPEDVLGWPDMIRCMAIYSMYFAPPHIFKWGCACEHEVMGPIHELYHVTKLFQTFKESVMGLSHPSVKIAFSGLDARIRAGTKELKARMEINKRLPGHSVSCEDSLKNGLDKLSFWCFRANQCAHMRYLINPDLSQLKLQRRLVRIYRKLEKEVIWMFQRRKANVVRGIDGYFMGSPKPGKFHIKDASAFEGYHYPVRNIDWKKYRNLLHY